MVEIVASALRLSEKAAEKLKPEIERHIRTARMDLSRMGCPDEVVGSDNALVQEAIVTYCMAKMGEESRRDAYMEAYLYQADSIRKSAKLKEGTIYAGDE